MNGFFLTTRSVILCPHGGQVQLQSSARLEADGAPVLLQPDPQSIVGCAFQLPGPKPSPCVRLVWTTASLRSTVDDKPVVTHTSMGLCQSAEGLPQGPPNITLYQRVMSDE